MLIRWLEKHDKISFLITIIIAILIFYISSLQFEPSPYKIFNWKPIIYHITAFFFLSAFLAISLSKKSTILITTIIAILYGISDEIHQLFVPGRGMSLFDILANSTGIILAAVIYILIKKRKSPSNKRP